MNQLQAVALNEGLRYKKRLWREAGRQQLEAFRLAPWASRRRQDLLELLDRLNPTSERFNRSRFRHFLGPLLRDAEPSDGCRLPLKGLSLVSRSFITH